MSGPVAISDIDGVRGFVSFGVDPTALGVPSWDIPTAALVTSMSWAPATLAMLAYSRFVGDGWRIGASALDGDCRCGLTLTLGVHTKLGTLSLSECILLPRVHDELGGSQQTLQRRLGRIGRVLLEGLLQIVLEQSVGAIILARVMEVSEDLFEFAEEQRLRIGWHVAIVGQGRDELLRELLAGQCDVGLVDRDGLPHRLVQIVPLVVSAYEIVKCRKWIALSEGLKDEGDLPTHLPV